VLSNKPDWLKNNKVTILVQLALERHPQMPDVPTVLDVASTQKQRDVLELVFSQSAMGRALFGPPSIPPARLNALRASFDHMMVDAEFLSDAEQMKIEINQPMSGLKIADLINKLYKSKPETVKLAAEAIEVAQ
jgi:tripartite-type tricarboxylate transporter receptor subunit TctC